MILRTIFFLTVGCFLTACQYHEYHPDIVQGMKPVYIQLEGSTDSIGILDFHPVDNYGKIVYASPYLFVNERFKGIHIYDNADPANPAQLAFISIPGNTDFSVRGNMIYANNLLDLVSIKLPAFDTIQLTNRIPDFFEKLEIASPSPPNYFGYFECVDDSKGYHVGWEMETLNNPKCYSR